MGLPGQALLTWRRPYIGKNDGRLLTKSDNLVGKLSKNDSDRADSTNYDISLLAFPSELAHPRLST